MNATEVIVGRSGLDALTIRAVARAAGFSTAAVYQMYGSREALIGHAWLRAAHRFVALLTTLVAEADTAASPVDEVLAAAETALVYPQRYPRSGILLMVVSRQEIGELALPDEITEQLHRVDHEFGQAMARLSVQAWHRNDADALHMISACVVDMPQHILAGRRQYSSSVVRQYLRAAVRGIVEVGPPPLAANARRAV